MIDIIKAKKFYKKYISKYNPEEPRIALKIAHIYRTAEKAKWLAEKLKLNQEDILLEQYDEHGVALSYSRRWLKENTDYPTLLNNFIYLFGYTDSTMRSMFVSLQSEMSAIEAITGVQGEKAYSFGIKKLFFTLKF